MTLAEGLAHPRSTIPGPVVAAEGASAGAAAAEAGGSTLPHGPRRTHRRVGQRPLGDR